MNDGGRAFGERMRGGFLKRIFVAILIFIAIILCFRWISVSEQLSATQSALDVQARIQNILYRIIGDNCIGDDVFAGYAQERGMTIFIVKANEVSFPAHIDPKKVSKVVVLGVGKNVDWAKSEGIHLYFSVEGCLLNGV